MGEMCALEEADDVRRGQDQPLIDLLYAATSLVVSSWWITTDRSSLGVLV